MVRALPHGSDTRIDFGRIAAIAAAIAVHAAALLMLLMPMAVPQLQAVVIKPKPEIRWIEKEKTEPVVVPIVEERTVVTPTEPRPVTTPRPTTQTPVFETPVIVDGGNEAVIEPSIIDGGDVVGPSIGNGPLPSATLEYIHATSPRYPVAELRNGVEGTVVLRVLVDVDGKPIDVTVETSSGNRNLDKEARQHVLKTWRFKPAMQDGQAVQAYGLVPIAFSLQ